ncbi:MAG: DUF4430 domain-containing protein [Gaiellaceae bacterium]
MKRWLVFLLAFVLAGCGGGGREHGRATLWVTENRGARVMYTGTIPAGLDGIQAVERTLKVKTRYGGRYVQTINGISGSLDDQRDWFFFVDGIEGDRSAAEVHVHAGDVLWWDYRHWTPSTMSIPVVVGAYPHPFVDGGGTSVVAPDPALAQRIARQVHGVVNSKAPHRNSILVRAAYPASHVSIRRAGKGYVLELGLGIATKLAADEHALRFRF